MYKLSLADWVSMILVIIGGLNWGLISINQSWNVVELLSGGYGILSRLVYILVALAAVYLLVSIDKFTRK